MRTALICLSSLAILYTIAPRDASAQAADFTGTYTAADGAEQIVEQAIQQAVAKMNVIARPIARSRLKKTNSPYRVIRIEQQPAQLTFQFDHRKPLELPADGRAIKWAREDGEVLDVSARLQDGVITQTFQAEDGQRTNRFTLGPDGATMTLDVTVSSPRLPEPLAYSLDYHRQLGRENPHREFTGDGR